MPFQTYRVNVSLGTDDATWDYTTETSADPGEIVASIQTLHPDWTEIHIERIQHQYTEKK